MIQKDEDCEPKSNDTITETLITVINEVRVKIPPIGFEQHAVGKKTKLIQVGKPPVVPVS